MHKSRLGGIVIDSEGGDVDDAGSFWGAVFGREAGGTGDPADVHYRQLATPPEEVYILLQTVDHPSRIHLDIETDDIEAEAKRLEALGAQRVARIRDWLVMEAPTGHRFCLVPPVRSDFDERATVWP